MKQMLSILSKDFELIIWSSSQSEYTNKVASIIDETPRKLISEVLDVTNCEFSEDG
jgi:TFIIF-interacting CTD phosphatase-like protein